jgi:hypothetical protein
VAFFWEKGVGQAQSLRKNWGDAQQENQKFTTRLYKAHTKGDVSRR